VYTGECGELRNAPGTRSGEVDPNAGKLECSWLTVTEDVRFLVTINTGVLKLWNSKFR